MMSMEARLVQYAGPLLLGARTTILVSIFSIVFGFLLGIVINQIRKGRQPGLVNSAMAVYISFFRGTPLLVQLLMIFYLPSAIGLNIPPLVAAIITLSLNTGAFQSEILRAGFASIPKGQIEAARTFNIPPRAILLNIEIPEVVRITLPALTNEIIDIVKVSSLVSVISVTDVMRAGQELVAVSYRPLEVYILVGIVYFVLTAILAAIGKVAEKRYSRAYI